MAGPLDLRGRVTITNGGSGTLGAIRRDLTAIGNQTKRMSAGTLVGNALATGAANSKKFAANVGAATVGVWGLMSAVNKAEEFNRNVFGVGTAAMSENVRREAGKVVYDYDKIQEAMARTERTALALSSEIGQTPSRLSGIAEVLAKAGFDDNKLAATTRALAIISETDLETPASRLGEYASILETIYKPKPGEAFGNFMARQLDVVRVAAGETRLSVGSVMEGMRPFAALYAQLGMDETQSSRLLMAGIKGGGEATEVGHTHRSTALRLMIPTGPQMDAFNRSGLNRADYMPDLKAMSPKRAVQGLAATFTGIKGKFRTELEQDFDKASREGKSLDPEFLDRVRMKVAQKAGIDLSDMLSSDAFDERFSNVIFEAGKEVKVDKFWDDVVQKNFTPNQVASILERRRIGTLQQIMTGLKNHGAEYADKLAMADGSGVDAVQRVRDSTNFGNLQRTAAMWEKFQISIANSGGLQTALGGLTRLFEVLGSLPQPVGEMVVAAGLLAVALTPLSMLFRGLATIARAVGALFGAGRVAAAGGAGLAGVMGAGAGVAGSTAAGRLMAGGMTAAGAAAANAKVGARMSAGMSASGAAGSAAGTAGRFGARALSRLLLPLGIGMAGYDAYTGYQKDGWKGALLNPLTLGMYSGGAGASETSQPGSSQGSGLDPSAANQSAESVKQQIESVFASISLFSAGQQAMATLAAGITAGGAQAISAANSVAAGVRAAGQRVQLNTGPNMQPAR
jgi:hypothetical protein